MQRLRGLLLKREGGDRAMAEVLAAVPTAGLEAVLVAVERVLESGAVNAEHHPQRAGPSAADARQSLRWKRTCASPRSPWRTPSYDRLRSAEVDHG